MAARDAGEKFFADALPCTGCGGFDRYTVNGACVTCAKTRGSQRYAALDAAGLAEQKRRDRERYKRRLTFAADTE